MVSCGGGVVLREENVRLMKESGSVVLLTADPETVYERIRETGDRPVLKGHMNVPDIRQLMEKRRPYYEAAADFSVATDGKTSEEICREIVRRLAFGALESRADPCGKQWKLRWECGKMTP